MDNSEKIISELKRGKLLSNLIPNIIERKDFLSQFKYPQLGNTSVGFELELTSLISTNQIKSLFNIGSVKVRITGDSSLSAFDYSIEIESEKAKYYPRANCIEIQSPVFTDNKELIRYVNTLSTIGNIPDMYENKTFQINKTGGLHVHTKNSDLKSIEDFYNYLKNFLVELELIVPDHRIGNRWCQRLHSFDEFKYEKYRVVRYHDNYETVEYRLFPSTINSILILRYSLLCVEIMNYYIENQNKLQNKKLSLFDITDNPIILSFLNSRRVYLYSTQNKTDKNKVVYTKTGPRIINNRRQWKKKKK